MNSQTFPFIFYSIILILPCSELALRILGYRPFQQVEFHIEASPANCIIAHPRLGFALRPGDFEITINKGLRYAVQHGNDSLRHNSFTPTVDERQDSIYFFGCSYTYGMGLSDSLTFPSLVQKNRSKSYIKNFGVPGYGTVQTYLQIQELISRKEIPSMIIINYADFHDDRNALTPSYRRDLYLGYQRSHESVALSMQPANIPYIQMNSGESSASELRFCTWHDIYQSSSYRENFALVNFIQDVRDQWQTRKINKEKNTEYLFRKTQELCDTHNIHLLVTGLNSTPNTRSTLKNLEDFGINTLDISVDLSLEKYTNAPFDDHPNSRAHAIYAARITSFLNTFDQ